MAYAVQHIPGVASNLRAVRAVKTTVRGKATYAQAFKVGNSSQAIQLPITEPWAQAGTYNGTQSTTCLSADLDWGTAEQCVLRRSTVSQAVSWEIGQVWSCV